jgi:hypothetical protein
VVEIDAGDDRAIGVDRIDRIEAATETDFEDHHVDRLLRQATHDRQRRELEVGQRGVAACSFDRFEVRQQFFGGDAGAVDAAALFEVHEMRLDVQADAVARRQRDRLQHGAGRALAVGACHRDHRAIETQAEPVAHGQRALQRHVDRLRMQALAVGEPVLQIHATASADWRCKTASMRAMAPRN